MSLKCSSSVLECRLIIIIQSNGIAVLTLGQILLIENTRASNPLLGYYQDITASTAADVGGKGRSLSFAIIFFFAVVLNS